MNFFSALRRMLTNKPLKFVGHEFVDVVSHKMVNLYTDELGHEYLATSKWGWDKLRVCR